MPKPPKYSIASIQPVGRYALGVNWQDRHESIFPFLNLRRACPCLECEPRRSEKREPAESARTLDSVQRIQEQSLMLHWTDGHESLFLVEELRDSCGCALCKGEPDYPITGQ